MAFLANGLVGTKKMDVLVGSKSKFRRLERLHDSKHGVPRLGLTGHD